jgi:arylsulfatase A-like enzyme
VIRRVAALLLGLPMLACSAIAPSEAPNVVIVLVDDLGWGQLGYNGDIYHQTPNIDRLAAEGLVMSNAYAASPLCSPTRASLLTGRHPARLNLTLPLAPEFDGPKFDASHAWQRGAPPRNFPLVTPIPVDRLAAEEVTLAERFAEAGWATGLIGKWHLGSKPGTGPGEQGFGAFAVVGYTSGPWSHFSPYGVSNLDPVRRGEYLADRLTHEAVEFIEAHADEPFFLLLSHFAIHAPFEAKQELLEHYEARTEGRASRHMPAIAAMLHSVDESVGTVLETLEQLALEERTLVVFVSDNGASTGKGKRQANAPLRGGKASLWEGGIRVPLLLHWPGVIAPQRRSALPVSSVDLFPTLLELAGLSQDLDRPLDGRSFASLVRGGQAPEPRPLYFHHPHYAGPGPSAAIRDGSLKLLLFFGGKRFLYDLDRDPGEQRNLAPLRPADASRLEAELFRWLEEVGAQLPRRNPAYDPKRPRR